MNVPKGYKRTEVGVIPEEWEVKSVREIALIKTGPFGTLLKANEYTKTDGVPLISVGEVGQGAFKVTEHTPRVSEKTTRRLPQYVLRCGDVVFGRKGAVDRSALVTNGEDGWFLGSDGISIRPQAICHPPYLACQFQRHAVQRWLLQHAIGTTMPSMNQGILGRVQIPYAPIPEQRAIAEALGDVDVLLGALDAAIAKQLDLKQATMQQLLTGQSRLPGFAVKWKTKRLGDHITFLKNGAHSRAELSAEGRVKYLHYGDIHTCSDAFLSPHDFPALPIEKARPLDRLCDGDVVWADASEDIAGVGRSVELRDIGHTEVVAGQHTIAARFDKSVLADGFKGLLQHCHRLTTHLRRLAAGTKVYATNRAHIASAEMPLPEVAEQIAIAAVLSDMDAKLASLASRRTKTADLKQSMMQSLLTGRIRLV